MIFVYTFPEEERRLYGVDDNNEEDDYDYDFKTKKNRKDIKDYFWDTFFRVGFILMVLYM